MSHRNSKFIASLASAYLATLGANALAADKNVYAYQGLAFGRAKAAQLCDSLKDFSTVFTTCDTSSNSWKLFGGYRFHKYLGVEASYADFGSFKGDGRVASLPVNAKVKASGIGLTAVGLLPVNDEISLMVKAGSVRWRARTTLHLDHKYLGEDSESGYGFATGIGANYFFDNDVGLRFEFETIRNVGKQHTIQGANISIVSLGLVMRF